MIDYREMVTAGIPQERRYEKQGAVYEDNPVRRAEAVEQAASLLAGNNVVALQVVHTEYRWAAEEADPQPCPEDYEDEDEFYDADDAWEERWKSDLQEDIVPTEVTISYHVVVFSTVEEALAALEEDDKMLFLPSNNSALVTHEEGEGDLWTAFDYDTCNPRGWHSFVRVFVPETAPTPSPYRTRLLEEAPRQRLHTQALYWESIPLEQAVLEAEVYLAQGKIVVLHADYKEIYTTNQEVPACVQVSYHASPFDHESELEILYRTHPLEEEGFYYAFKKESEHFTFQNIARVFRP